MSAMAAGQKAASDTVPKCVAAYGESSVGGNAGAAAREDGSRSSARATRSSDRRSRRRYAELVPERVARATERRNLRARHQTRAELARMEEQPTVRFAALVDGCEEVRVEQIQPASAHRPCSATWWKSAAKKAATAALRGAKRAVDGPDAYGASWRPAHRAARRKAAQRGCNANRRKLVSEFEDRLWQRQRQRRQRALRRRRRRSAKS